MQHHADADHTAGDALRYEPPAIEEREPLNGPLIGLVASGTG
jgi:hypothetical protein